MRATNLLFALGLMAPATAAQESPWRFREVAPDCGIDFHHTFGGTRFRCILEDTGAGVALLDYDGDGRLDVYMVDGCWLAGIGDPAERPDRVPRNRLYRNLGEGRFEDVTDTAGAGDEGYGMGAVVGDPDGDGDPDLLVLNYGSNTYYRNDGGRFVDATAELGLAGPLMLSGSTKWSVGGCFFDADGDRDLDLLVANYIGFDPDRIVEPTPGEPYAGPDAFPAQRGSLYRNEGGRFLDVSEEHGLSHAITKTMGVSLADFDEDGFPEIFEAGDSVPNLLFRREGSRWVEVGLLAGVALDRAGNATSAMHGSVGDVDGDGRLDLYVPDLDGGCFYRNLGGGCFDEVGDRWGVSRHLRGQPGWASHFADFDLDGDLDLLVVTGGAFSPEAVHPLRLLRNDRDEGFSDVSTELGPDFGLSNGRGAAFGDLDGDGDVDLVVNRKDAGGRASVLLNELPPGRHWLRVALVGLGGDTEGLGARVELWEGERRQVREVRRGGSYLSQNDPRAHFGVPSGKVDRLRVRWPSGRWQEVAVEGVDRDVVVHEVAEPPSTRPEVADGTGRR